MSSPALTYRRDIDGLRAIAVVSVVLFHAGVWPFTGGYVGVDIFFVISGYLITKILLRNLSIIDFYQRRARRILPALLTMILITAVVSLFVMLPHDLTSMAKSAAATIAFISNIFFWRQAGYFKPEVELMPLLHTWSLGVEEQFYIVFPLLLIFARKWDHRKKTWLIILITLGSLALAIFGMHMRAEQAVFYLSPTRAWELGFGAILATGVVPVARTATTRSLVALAGLGGILWPIFFYTATTKFPGLAALPPVLGSAALIHAGVGGEKHIFSRLLGSRPFVAIGLISYSLYLWHWPILALARYRLVRDPTALETAGALVLMLLAGYLSWRFVERPFRSGFTDRQIWRMSFAGMGALTALALVITLAGGFPKRFSERVVALNSDSGVTFKCPLTDMVAFGGAMGCDVTRSSLKDPKNPDFILWGDSHAQMYAPAYMRALAGQQAMVVHVYSCSPARSPVICGGSQARVYNAILASRASVVFMAQNWASARDRNGVVVARKTLPADMYFDAAIEIMKETVMDLRKHGKTVVLITPIPRPGFNVPSTFSREIAFFGKPIHPTEMTYAAYKAEYADVLAAMEDLAKLPGISVLHVDQVMCKDGSCPYFKGSVATYSDLGHLSEEYAESLAPLFSQGVVDARKELRLSAHLDKGFSQQ